jgi:FixJ family two-component response regulator
MIAPRGTEQERLGRDTVISIVDDNALSRDGLADWIESLGFKVRTFESAEEFIGADCAALTCCLITDLHMPGMSGLDLQRQLRREGHSTPVIIVTAYPNEMHRAQAFEAGATGFLVKPVNEQSLLDCLERAAGQGGCGAA